MILLIKLHVYKHALFYNLFFSSSLKHMKEIRIVFFIRFELVSTEEPRLTPGLFGFIKERLVLFETTIMEGKKVAVTLFFCLTVVFHEQIFKFVCHLKFIEMDDFVKKDSDSVFSKVVKAGKRTYFFDVKTTRQSEHYITITESKKIFEDNGGTRFEKHKIFLYKEDFEKFMDCFNEALQYIKDNASEADVVDKSSSENFDKFTDVQFEDLEK